MPEVSKPVLSMSLRKAIIVVIAVEIATALIGAWLIRHSIF